MACPAATPSRTGAASHGDEGGRGAAPPAWLLLVAGAAACGTAVALSVPPFGLWPLGWIGIAGLALLLPGSGPRRRAAIGLVAGLAQYGIGLWWLQEFTIPGCVAVIVLSALFPAAAFVFLPARRAAAWAALPPMLVVATWARDHYPLGGLPLGDAALGQASSPLAPVLRLGGSVLLTGETALVGVTLAAAAHSAWRWWRRPSGALRRPVPLRWVASAAALGLLSAVLVVAGRLSPSGAGPGARPPIRVALVQGGGRRGTRAIRTDPQLVFDRDLAASETLSPPLNLVVWPEGAMQTSVPFTETSDAAAVASLAESLDATVLAGVEQDVGSTRFLNEAVAWGPDGRVIGRYEKVHRVPFGEYVPDRALFARFFNLADVPRNAIPGHGPGFVATPAGPLGIMISFEVFFDRRALAAVRAGGQILVVPTDTASYRSVAPLAEEVAADEERARETGRFLVQVTPTGYSVVVTPGGKVVERSRLDVPQVVEATVPLRSGETVYDRTGDLPVLAACVVALAGAWALGLRVARRARRPGAQARR